MTVFLAIADSCYVKVNLLENGERRMKWKTASKKNSSVYNEMCELDVSQVNLLETEIEVIAMKHVRLGQNLEIGLTKLGDNEIDYKTGEYHWTHSMTNIGQPSIRWHLIVLPESRRLMSSSRSRSRSRSQSRSRSRSPLLKMHKHVVGFQV